MYSPPPILYTLFNTLFAYHLSSSFILFLWLFNQPPLSTEEILSKDAFSVYIVIWDIPSIEAIGLSVVRDAKASYREAWVMWMRIYNEKYIQEEGYIIICQNVLIYLYLLESIMDLDLSSLSISVEVAPYCSLQVSTKLYIYIYIYI